jgi:N utilization substance protein A
MKGSRVQSIIRELRGEKIDIIEWSDDLVTFAQSALAPAKITRVSVTHHGDAPHLDVIVEDEQLSLAIGKRGQNVRLASELIGARIDIKSESDVKDEVADALAKMLQVDFGPSAAPLTDVEGVDEALAERLQEAGFGDAEALLSAEVEELTAIEGVGEELADALKSWAEEQPAPGEHRGSIEGAEHTTTTMDDSDFMAALSKAFQESAQEEPESEEDDSGDLDALAAALSELSSESEEDDSEEAAEKNEEEV